jgi:hypothetical protein
MINRINDVLWFTPGGPNTDGKCIGIVLTTDAITNQQKAYIGLGNGKDEKADIELITDWGAQLDPHTAQYIAGHLTPPKADTSNMSGDIADDWDHQSGWELPGGGWSIDRF